VSSNLVAWWHVSPRASNREALLEGAIRCLQERGYANTRARDIATAAGANLASIGYHFGSTEQLLAEALAESFKRWLTEFAVALGRQPARSSGQLLAHAAEALRDSLEQHRGLAIAFLEALARAPRSEPLRQALADSYEQRRDAVTRMFDTGADEIGETEASILMAIFDGLLIQWLLDPQRMPDGRTLARAMRRIGQRTTKR
jgi:AcrR family transcriptional regulator